jgi:hypothetical protein
MIKVKDIDGKEIRGVYRSPNGSLVVNDSSLLSKYNNEKNSRMMDKEKIKTLESEVSNLKMMVEQLLEKIKT